MNFEQPIVLWALAGLVPVVLLLIRAYLLGLRDIRLLIPAQERQNVERVLWFKWIVSSTATVLMFASIVIAIADPVWGEEDVESERSELDISIAFDVSRSMYAADVSPSRLDASRDAVSSLLDRFPDSRVGITVFRGGASRVLPVTGDRIALEYVLSTAGPGMITTPGTDLGAGIGEAIDGLPAGSNRHGAILLISDGEDLSDEATSAAERAARIGVPVFVIGVGDREGTGIRMPDGDPVLDADGDMVISSLDEQTLKQIAETTQAAYVNLSDSEGITRIEEDLRAFEEGGEAYRLRPKERYSLFTWIAIFCAVVIVITRLVRWRDMF